MIVVCITAGGAAAYDLGLDGEGEAQSLCGFLLHFVLYVTPNFVDVLLVVVGKNGGKQLVEGKEACTFTLRPRVDRFGEGCVTSLTVCSH